MAINQLIAAGIQQPRFESPLNMMAQLSQLEAAREANALRQVQMQRLQRQEQQENELGALLARGAPLTVQTVGRFGKTGLDVLTAQRQADLAQRQLEEKDAAKQEKQRMAVAKAMYSTLGDPSRENFDNTFRFLKEQGLTKDIEPIFAEMMMQTPEQRRQSIISFANAVPGMQAYFQDFDKQRAEIEAKKAEALYKGAQTRELSMKMAGTLPEPAGAPPEIIRLQRSLSNLPPNDPNRRAIEERIEALGKPAGTTVNVGAGEKAEDVERGKSLVAEEKETANAAQAARRQLTSIDSAQRVLNTGFRTGFGTETKLLAASLLGALGVKDANKFATNAQAFLQATMEGVLTKQNEQKGVQTDQDAVRIRQTVAQLGNTPESNQFILDVARATAKRTIEQDQFYRKWLADNKTMRGARDAWFQQEGDKSIFDRPELQKYTQPAEPRSAGRSGVLKWSELETREDGR
jgi:hypothetical protein